jgi:alpha-glucan,water dikinase
MNEKIITLSGLTFLVERRQEGGFAQVTIRAQDPRGCILHWGLARHPGAPWQVPPAQYWPEGSKGFGRAAVQTPFPAHDGQAEITIRLGANLGLPFLDFALFFPEEDRWDNNNGKNYRLALPVFRSSSLSAEEILREERPLPDPQLFHLAQEIIHAEMSRNSWTLMHRFNLCYELLDRVKGDPRGLAMLFVWLRFSALRQLDWQRNYNTKPRELSHALDRLTDKLAAIFAREPASREWTRMIMATLGRGGEGQRIRDEILEIMHRHHIKEVSGHFMEEWHQKIHNNTTPDDVVICEAYLEFLRSNGDLALFYKTLEAGGVSRERLESFERPIKTPPDFVPPLKEALIHDFEHFLGTLKSVHSGADLGIAIQSARASLDPKTVSLMDFLWAHREDRESQAVALAPKIIAGRRLLSARLGQAEAGRDLLFLDIALENFLRAVVERTSLSKWSAGELADLIGIAAESWLLSRPDEELDKCLRHWERVGKRLSRDRDGALRAAAVLERLGRIVGTFIDGYQKTLQPQAEFLGRAFQADPWTVNLFTEEVVRGSPAFVLSTVLRHFAPLNRTAAGLGPWQVVSTGGGTGRVEVVENLKSIQGRHFEQPTVMISQRVEGDEEIPPGVIAVLTPQTVDIVSHVAIRARNNRVLLATSYEPERLRHLQSLAGHGLRLVLTPTNELTYEEAMVTESNPSKPGKPAAAESREVTPPSFTAYAILPCDFKDHVVGGKSINQTRLAGKLPGWVHLPRSVALPFGVFEKVLGEGNRAIQERYLELLRRADETTDVLPELRESILSLGAPPELTRSFHDAMSKAGMPWPGDWEKAWTSIKRVWASKWNERAYFSRKGRRLPHEGLTMAVLVQEVVEADYAFVIHTVNPFSGAKEIYAEVVLGLGETLVANYPGRALSFSFSKDDGQPRLLMYPSKSFGLYGGGLIFRSDSSGEDLPGYAGAGLYDSIMLNPPRKVFLDYTEEPLVWDVDFQKKVLAGIAQIGLLTEKALGFPQDIEGAFAQGEYYVVQTRPQVGIDG